MKIQVMQEPGVITFQEVDMPKVTEQDVCIRIERIGICGSDIHVYHGKHPFTPYPVTQGHEASGVIVAVGSLVERLKVGDKVTIEPQLVCGDCHPCRAGRYNVCEELKVMGFQAPGMAAEYFTVNQSKVTKLPSNMSFDEGALIEPLAVAVHAIKRAKKVQGKNIVVLGAGPIGNLVAQTARAYGAAKVLITDISDFRLDKAREVGIDVCINTLHKDLGDAIEEHFGPDKADFIYDCAGNNTTMGQAIRYARKGSTIILVAVFDGKAEIDLAVLNDHELKLDTSMMYLHEDYIDAIRIASEALVDLQALITKHFPIQKFKEAYEYIDENREESMKVIIDVQA